MNRRAMGLIAWCSLPMAAMGQTEHYQFAIDGLQQVPPNASPASGFGDVLLDTVTNQLSWNISFTGLIAPPTAMHFHGAAGPGVNAGVQINIGAISGLSSPSIGNTTITNAQKSDLLAGLWYVNIHTSAFPGGEIRGQVVPTHGAVALLGVAGLMFAMPRKR